MNLTNIIYYPNFKFPLNTEKIRKFLEKNVRSFVSSNGELYLICSPHKVKRMNMVKDYTFTDFVTKKIYNVDITNRCINKLQCPINPLFTVSTYLNNLDIGSRISGPVPLFGLNQPCSDERSAL